MEKETAKIIGEAFQIFFRKYPQTWNNKEFTYQFERYHGSKFMLLVGTQLSDIRDYSGSPDDIIIQKASEALVPYVLNSLEQQDENHLKATIAIAAGCAGCGRKE